MAKKQRGAHHQKSGQRGSHCGLGINYSSRLKEQQWGLPTPPIMRDSSSGYGRKCSESDVHNFHSYLNNINPNINLSMEYSQRSINFLDVSISVNEDGQLQTSIFRKPTDRNTLLHADSFHPSSLKSNIPLGQFQRLKRICSSNNDFSDQASNMYSRFRQRGYKKDILDNALTKVKSTERKELFKKKAKTTNKNRIFCSLQYGNLSNRIRSIITKNWGILKSDPTLAATFNEPPLFAIRRAPTLGDHLVQNYLPGQQTRPFFPKPVGTFQCGACNYCQHINKTKTFQDSTLQKTFHCRCFANCNTTHVVYRLDCSCGCFYIGLTKRRLRDRFAEHKYAIRTQNPNYPIAQHFKLSPQCNMNLLKVMVIEVISLPKKGGDKLRTLSQRETFWIDTLKATQYPGLNEDLDLSPFL